MIFNITRWSYSSMCIGLPLLTAYLIVVNRGVIAALEIVNLRYGMRAKG